MHICKPFPCLQFRNSWTLYQFTTNGTKDSMSFCYHLCCETKIENSSIPFIVKVWNLKKRIPSAKLVHRSFEANPVPSDWSQKKNIIVTCSKLKINDKW